MPQPRREGAAVAPTPLPAKTPITQLGLTAAQAKLLTPAARKLTRGDLLAMMQGKAPKAAKGLTVKDLSSITQVYAASLAAVRPQPGCCCCCCDPCCCCCCASLGTLVP